MATSHRGAPSTRVTPEFSASAQLQGTLLDALESAVVACDSHGRVLFANASATSLWPSTAAGAVPGWAQFELLNDAGASVTGEAHPLQRALAGERVQDLYYVTGGDGHIMTVLVSAGPLPAGGPGEGSAMMAACEQRESESEARLRNYISDF